METKRFPIALVLDDESDIVGLIMSALVNEGWSVVGFCNQREALEFAKKNTIELLIIDIKMPGMDGLQCIKDLSGDGVQIPTIIQSGYLEPMVMPDQCVSINKPFSRETLVGAIAQVVKSRS